jgi:hypothetical protein
MVAAVRRPSALVALLCSLLACVLVAGCGGGSDGTSTPQGGVSGVSKLKRSAPKTGADSTSDKAAASLGFPDFATKNTTRVGGADPITDAAGVALAVFPSGSKASRPKAVALADARDWRPATAAAALMAPPIRAPLLLSAGNDLPSTTRQAIDTLKPSGSDAAGGGQVIAVGQTAKVPDKHVTRIAPRRPGAAELAAGVDRFLSAARGKPSDSVMVVSSAEAAYGVPAAAYAAKTGDPVLFVNKDTVPVATKRAIQTHAKPRIYVLGPSSVVSAKAVATLKKLGTVVRIGAKDPVANAIAFARYTDGSFGWGVVDPGHGLLFASGRRPLDGPAAAALASSGTYGPLLLLDRADKLPKALRSFLLDIQPGYRNDPVRGVYNRAWILGDEGAVAARVQAQIDSLLEIVQVQK